MKLTEHRIEGARAVLWALAEALHDDLRDSDLRRDEPRRVYVHEAVGLVDEACDCLARASGRDRDEVPFRFATAREKSRALFDEVGRRPYGGLRKRNGDGGD